VNTSLRSVIGLLIFTAIFLTGCGNSRFANMAPEPSVKTSAASSSSSEFFDGNYDQFYSTYYCPSSWNIKPYYDFAYDGSNYYLACLNRTNPSNIIIDGMPSEDGNICVFAAKRSGNSITSFAYQCAAPSTAGLQMTFTNLNFNYLFIVPEKDRAQMSNCLSSGNRYACPHYSEGYLTQ
jgi:hypothetical protein